MPTPAENGRTVLDIYAHFNSRAGQSLLSNNFVAVASRQRIPVSDIQIGLDYASQRGWVDNGPNGALRLTPDGEKAMQRGS